MRTALVTGAPDWVPPVTIALKSEGFEILSAGHDVPLAPETVDCYVQLPGDVTVPAEPGLYDVRSMVTDELLVRVDLMARLAPSLSPSATVVLVGSEPLQPMLELLARSVGSSPRGVKTSVVAGGRPDQIAALARGVGSEPAGWQSYLEVDPEVGFADWRDAVFCLKSAGPAG